MYDIDDPSGLTAEGFGLPPGHVDRSHADVRPGRSGPLDDSIRPHAGWPTVSVVVPAMNEARNLPAVLPRIPLWVHEVILVDGGSQDDTVAIARRLLPDVRIVHQTGRGKGDALIVGLRAASGSIVVTLDADGSADAAEIPAFVGALLSGAEFAKGTRFVQGGGTSDMEWYRSTGNHCLRLLARMLFGASFSDLCYGYNAFWRDAVERLDLDCDGFEIETLMALRAVRADLRITEVASFEAPRLHGTSNLRTVRDGCRVLRTIVAERLSLQHRAHATAAAHLRVRTIDLDQDIDRDGPLVRGSGVRAT